MSDFNKEYFVVLDKDTLNDANVFDNVSRNHTDFMPALAELTKKQKAISPGALRIYQVTFREIYVEPENTAFLQNAKEVTTQVVGNVTSKVKGFASKFKI